MRNIEGLRKCKEQFRNTSEDATNFIIGEKVYHKSSFEVLLTVIGIKDNFVIAEWEGLNGKNRESFIPQEIIHHTDASQIIYDDKYQIDLN